MTSSHRLRVSIAAARYLEASDCGDHAAFSALWGEAAHDPELLAAIQELHDGLAEELSERDRADAAEQLLAVVAYHLAGPSVDGLSDGPVTVAAVADELFRHPAGGLPPAAHALNERLRGLREPLPEALGVTKLIAWGARFGPAPEAYWRAFREAAIRLELRSAAGAEYQLAARAAPPQPGGWP